MRSKFGLAKHICSNTAVAKIEPADTEASSWKVTLASGESRIYLGVVIANGHHWDPSWPKYPGQFDGLTLHSAQYKTPDILAGKRVLVIGAGNSGCDIAVESALVAARTFQSLRRGYHFIPKFIRGKPADRCGEFLLRWHVPLWLRRRIISRTVFTAIGRPEDYGLPAPDHKFLETHPIINSQMLYYVGHGRIKPKPDVAELCGDRVQFVDGTSEPIDVIVYATGFHLTIPFIDREHLNWRNGKPELYLNMLHPRYDNLFIAGMIQPDSGLWGLVHYQAELLARFITAQRTNPQLADRLRSQKLRSDQAGGGIHYVRTPRHLLEVEHFGYRRRLKQLIAQFD